MKISYKWLREYLPGDYQRTPEELSEILTDTGLEVEGVEEVQSVPGGLKGIVIGQVLTCEKHANADKLNCTVVDLGTEQVPIVCGAPNVAKGQKVLVATVGATIHPSEGEPFKIKKAKIRGEVSQGMICAEDELSLGQSHDGIMVLPEDAPVGKDAASYLNITSDFLIEIGLTPNRTDAMSHLGVARDIVAALNHKEKKNLNINFEIPGWQLSQGSCGVEIEIHDQDRCPRYAGLVASNLKVADSPQWLKDRLSIIGVKSINNVVDITNYICHGFGHPMHAFDLKVVGDKVVVRTANQEENFTTLDEVDRKLDSEDLMICNAHDPMCIAGVFGGIKSGVNSKTEAIFLESAYFNPVSVRKTAKRHALNTDASFRYERGIDPIATIDALKLAAKLLQDLCGASISTHYYDSNPEISGSQNCSFYPAKLNEMAGIEISESDMKSILSDLDIEVLSESEDGWELKVPAYRADVTRHADICEEILRIFGFNNIPIPTKISLTPAKRPRLDKHALREQVSNFLSARGFSEGMSNGLSNVKHLENLGDSLPAVQLLNPLSSDLGALRASLLFSAIDALKHNLKFAANSVAIYEFGKQYFKSENGYRENEVLSMFLSGKNGEERWDRAQENWSWVHLKTQIFALIEKFNLGARIKVVESNKDWMNYGLELKVKKQTIATWGSVSNKLMKANDIKAELFYCEFDFDAFYTLVSQSKTNISELPKFPGTRRDLSLLLDAQTQYQELEMASIKAASGLLQKVSLFDVYEGKNLEKGKKSYALSFEFRHQDKTLTDKEVDKEMDKITQALQSNFNASLR